MAPFCLSVCMCMSLSVFVAPVSFCLSPSLLPVLSLCLFLSLGLCVCVSISLPSPFAYPISLDIGFFFHSLLPLFLFIILLLRGKAVMSSIVFIAFCLPKPTQRSCLIYQTTINFRYKFNNIMALNTTPLTHPPFSTSPIHMFTPSGGIARSSGRQQSSSSNR